MNSPPIVSPQEWESARGELLVKEKELTRARDALAAGRRRMPWMAVERRYPPYQWWDLHDEYNQPNRSSNT